MLKKNNDNINSKINLKKKIQSLNNKDSYLIILKFLINNNIKYTENSNGIFFNLKMLSNELILELRDLVNNSEKNDNLNYNNNYNFV